MITDYYYTVVIQRRTPTTNSFGDTTYSWATHLTTTGLISDNSPQEEQILQNQYQIRNAYNFYTDTGQDITQNDRVLYDSKAYRIVTAPKNTVSRNHHFKFILEKLDTDEV